MDSLGQDEMFDFELSEASANLSYPTTSQSKNPDVSAQSTQQPVWR